MTALQPYRAVVSARFRTLLQYRAAALAGLWTQVFWGLVLWRGRTPRLQASAALQSQVGADARVAQFAG